jgi:hypothetical protein
MGYSEAQVHRLKREAQRRGYIKPKDRGKRTG